MGENKAGFLMTAAEKFDANKAAKAAEQPAEAPAPAVEDTTEATPPTVDKTAARAAKIQKRKKAAQGASRRGFAELKQKAVQAAENAIGATADTADALKGHVDSADLYVEGAVEWLDTEMTRFVDSAQKAFDSQARRSAAALEARVAKGVNWVAEKRTKGAQDKINAADKVKGWVDILFGVKERQERVETQQHVSETAKLRQEEAEQNQQAMEAKDRLQQTKDAINLSIKTTRNDSTILGRIRKKARGFFRGKKKEEAPTAT